MKNSRRGFINNILSGSIGAGTIPLFSFISGEKGTKARGKELPVIHEADICVLGGSCTGVFAAVRAARLGAKVVIIEKQNAFGGVATNSLVNVWHSLLDTEFKRPIIAGLTLEMMDRLMVRHAAAKDNNNQSVGFTFNSQELKIELDELVIEAGIHPYLHTLFSEPYLDKHGKLIGVIVDNKSGRGIINAKYFIDATGDGDLCHRLGMDSFENDLLQPPTTCAHFDRWNDKEFYDLLKKYGHEFNIPDGFVWGKNIPASKSYMLAGTRVLHLNCSIGDDLTKAEMEGRRQIRAIMDMIRKYGSPEKTGLVALPSQIGIRETRHIKCMYQVTEEDTLYGKHFEDAIANGSYRLDLHHQEKPGITFKYLDGTQVYSRPGFPNETSLWREKMAINPTFYQVPLRSIIPQKFDNVMIAGRMLDACKMAFSGIRVMVNMNQLGEAAGVTSWLAMNQNKPVQAVKATDVRTEMAKGGSLII